MRKIEMNINRRDFVRNVLMWGAALFLEGPVVRAAGQSRPDLLPAYARLHEDGRLKERVQQAYAIFEACTLCPRECGANRLSKDKGFCRAAAKLKVYSSQPHFGE